MDNTTEIYRIKKLEWQVLTNPFSGERERSGAHEVAGAWLVEGATLAPVMERQC